MEARELYDKKLKEDPSIGTVQLMEEYAKHVIEEAFCDGSPIEFEQMSIQQLRDAHNKILQCVDWVNGVDLTLKFCNEVHNES